MHRLKAGKVYLITLLLPYYYLIIYQGTYSTSYLKKLPSALSIPDYMRSQSLIKPHPFSLLQLRKRDDLD